MRGHRYPVHNFGGIKLGTAICYDNLFPEVHRIFGLEGADLIFSPYAYGAKFKEDDAKTVKDAIAMWKDQERTGLRAAAFHNYVWIVVVVGGGHVKDYVAAANPGQGKDDYFPGVILFIHPNGIVVKESPDDKIRKRLRNTYPRTLAPENTVIDMCRI